MKKLMTQTVVTLTGLFFAGSALAHTGQETTASFAEGFLHPLTGLDHLFALVLIGLFSATCSRKTAAGFISFVSAALLGGFVVGVQWSQASSAEGLVGLSMLLLPVSLIMFRFSVAIKALAVLAIGVFSVSHGLVQGAEAQGMLFQYGVGTMLASMLVIAGTAAIVSQAKKAVLQLRTTA